jgi:predicted ATP-dependent serine protease
MINRAIVWLRGICNNCGANGSTTNGYCSKCR